MDRNMALSALIDLRQILIEEGKPKIAEALDIAIEALRESTDKYTNATTNLYDSRLAKDLLGISEEAKKLRMFEGDVDSATTTDCISRQAAIEAMAPFDTNHELRDTLESLPPVEDMGEVSDGYHTFNQLYHQRAVLFATIVNQNKDKAWKSWKHEDGKFCFDKEGEWFIVGVDTPEGSYTYHYEKKYWDLFDCEELDRGKHWDGHTEDDVTRLLSLPPVEPKRPEIIKCKNCRHNNNCEIQYAAQAGSKFFCGAAERQEGIPPVEPERPKGEWVDRSGGIEGAWHYCSVCGNSAINNFDFCPNCGADMRGDKE